MQITWRTQVKHITIAIIAAVAIAGGVQIASEGSAAGSSAGVESATVAAGPASTPTPTATPDEEEWH
ncbi:hypothetical protein Slala03_49400 [Streptomyces lavendulae subsp. lavendulae]|uniref:hypothetical protein n=1 Tax=Streptomyces lavendulae TaxID=1914 RepID=UPI0024A0D131|nr:hypothetical protein [Streptomyces lavendulae]GLV85251.1 hypothetical protein Slala03_49400 [Streptomyces lavendulae subsp. lavendulae]